MPNDTPFNAPSRLLSTELRRLGQAVKSQFTDTLGLVKLSKVKLDPVITKPIF